MNAFARAVDNREARTTNGMKARATTASKNVDLFFKIGASRGKNIIPDFTGAYGENPEYALRIAQWARDVRGGSGERQIFKDIITQLISIGELDHAKVLLNKAPELGRWDDVLVAFGTVLESHAMQMIADALVEGIKAKELLGKIDQMSEEECQYLLDTVYN